MKRATNLFSLLNLIATAVLVAPLVAQEVGLPVGTDAPVIELEDLDGQLVDLGQLIGNRPILLEFWASWCSECAKLAPELDAAHERFGDEVEFLIVAVAVNQSKRRVRQHLERNEHPYRMLWDGSGRAVRAYKVPTTAVVVVIDRNGKVAYTGVGGEQDLVTAVEGVAQQ
jgi:peroxiredoxin